MRAEFAEFETRLSSILSGDVEAGVGVDIQKDRYRRDRYDWLKKTLRGAFRETADPALDAVLETYLATVGVQSGDYGNWRELGSFVEFALKSELSYDTKSAVYFYAACIAAQQIEEGVEGTAGIPFLDSFLRFFHIEESSILVSTFGFLARRFSLKGAARMTSIDGKVSVTEVPEFARDPAEMVRALAERHGWALDEKVLARLEKRAALPGFFGFGELELRSLLDSNEGKKIAATLSELAEVVYPVWKPDSLGLTITYFCNASCGHCYNASGSFRPNKCLHWQELRAHLEDWKALGVDEIGISGGEPFLFADELVEMVRGLRELGIERIVPFSNGFWGADRERAAQILTALKEAGLGSRPKDQVKISAGEFHQKDIQLDAVLAVCELHYDIIGTRCLLDIEQLTDREASEKIVRRAKELGVHEKIEWRFRSLVSDSGRAKAWYKDLPTKSLQLSEVRCPVKSRGALYPEGNWIYCTGTVFPKNFLGVGTLKTQNMFGMLARAQLDSRNIYLQLGTFQDFINDNPSSLFTSDQAVSVAANSTPCSLCPKVFGQRCK